MKNIKHIGIAGVLSLTVLLSGCGGSEPSSELPQTSEAPEVTSKPQSTEPEAPSAESSAPESASTTSSEQEPAPETAESGEEILGTLTVDSPNEDAGYSADWLYGTWSTVSLNGTDYWDFADERGIDGEVQFIFDSEGCDVLRGSEGIIYKLDYKVTDSGVMLRDNESGTDSALTYNAAEDTLTLNDDGNTIVYIRGSNPRKNGAQSTAGEGMYGLWSVALINGEDFWTSDKLLPEQYGEFFVEINESGMRSINNDGFTKYFQLQPTDNGAEFIDDRDGMKYTLNYDSTGDTITCFQTDQPDGDKMTLKRGSNPKDGVKRNCEWLYGTWSAVTMNGKDYWTFAVENNLDNEAQLVFTPDYCFAFGEGGNTNKYSFTADSTGVTIHVSDSYDVACMYNSSTDRMMVNDEQAGQTVVVKRGTNPRS